MAGRVGFAREDVDHAGEAVITGVAEPQAGIDVILLQPAELHRHCAVQKHDDLVKLPGFVDHLQQGCLVVGKGQQRFAVCGVARKVGVLGAVTGERDDGHVVVRREGIAQVVGIERSGNFAGGIGAVLDAAGSIGVIQRLVDLEAAVFERLRHVDHILVVGGGAARAAAVDGVGAVVAEQRHIALVRFQRQRTVVHQQHGALFLFFDAERIRICDQLFIPFVRQRAVFSAVVAARKGQTARRQAQRVVDEHGIAVGEHCQ